VALVESEKKKNCKMRQLYLPVFLVLWIGLFEEASAVAISGKFLLAKYELQL
jgi:hypothetical protein